MQGPPLQEETLLRKAVRCYKPSDSCLDTWMGREALAEGMIPVIGRLYRENNVVTSIHGRSLINKSTMDILKAHRFARRISKDELLLEETAPLLNTLAQPAARLGLDRHRPPEPKIQGRGQR